MLRFAPTPRGVLFLFVFLPLFPVLALALEQPPAQAWSHTWNGPSSLTDEVVGGVCDALGRLFVTGSSYHAIAADSREDFFLNCLDGNGQLMWSRTWGGPYFDSPSDLALQPGGNIAVVGVSGQLPRNLATVVHDPAGNLVWEVLRPVEGWFSMDHQPSLAVADDGALTVAAPDQDRILVVRYSPAGELLWELLLPALGLDMDLPCDVAVGPDGSAYVAGLILGLTESENANALFKIDPTGELAWTETETGNFGGFFEYAGVEVGPDGNPVMVGNPESFCGLFEERIWKVDAATGQRLWTSFISTEPCDIVEPSRFKLDAQGNALVVSAGRTEGTSDRMQTAKWSPDGQLLWYREHNSTGSLGGSAASLAVDAAGGVYVTGLTVYGVQDRDWTTVKYDADGTLQWVADWGAPGGGNDWALDVALTPAGDLAVFGLAWNGLPTYSDAVTILYDLPDVAHAAPQQAGYALHGCYPNPFNPLTTVAFELPRSGPVDLAVYDVKGRRVRDLTGGRIMAEGHHEVIWQGRDDAGQAVASGTYFLRLRAQGVSLHTSAVLLK